MGNKLISVQRNARTRFRDLGFGYPISGPGFRVSGFGNLVGARKSHEHRRVDHRPRFLFPRLKFRFRDSGAGFI